jgi:hypothetical protein
MVTTRSGRDNCSVALRRQGDRRTVSAAGPHETTSSFGSGPRITPTWCSWTCACPGWTASKPPGSCAASSRTHPWCYGLGTTTPSSNRPSAPPEHRSASPSTSARSRSSPPYGKPALPKTKAGRLLVAARTAEPTHPLRAHRRRWEALKQLEASDGFVMRWPVGRQVTRSLANRRLVVVATDYVLLTEAGRRALASDSQRGSRSALPDPDRTEVGAHRGPGSVRQTA